MLFFMKRFLPVDIGEFLWFCQKLLLKTENYL